MLSLERGQNLFDMIEAATGGNILREKVYQVPV